MTADGDAPLLLKQRRQGHAGLERSCWTKRRSERRRKETQSLQSPEATESRSHRDAAASTSLSGACTVAAQWTVKDLSGREGTGAMVMRLLLSDEALEEFVHFLSTTESRNKIYRLIQYGAKASKWVIMRACDLKAADLKEPIAQSAISLRLNGEKSLEERRPASTHDSRRGSGSQSNRANEVKEQARWLAVMLTRVESLFGDARKVYRLFQFLEMLDLFRHVSDADATVRLLRKLRITCFFFFYLLENYMVFLLRIEGFAHRHPRVVMLKRSCNGFWCTSIILAFALDYVTKRGGVLSTIKKLLDLPVAYIAFADQRVSDGLFGVLGIASAQIGVYLRWIEVMAKLRHKRLLARAGKKLLTTDLA